MPQPRDAALDLDDATAALGRALYAEVRRLAAAEREEMHRWPPKGSARRGDADGSSWSGGDACADTDGGGCDGGSD